MVQLALKEVKKCRWVETLGDQNTEYAQKTAATKKKNATGHQILKGRMRSGFFHLSQNKPCVIHITLANVLPRGREKIAYENNEEIDDLLRVSLHV